MNGYSTVCDRCNAQDHPLKYHRENNSFLCHRCFWLTDCEIEEDFESNWDDGGMD
jgi:recombinational DNA repair protein (RecF pathway)